MNVYDEYDKMKYSIGFVPQLDLIRSNDTVYRTLYDAALLRLPSDTTLSDLTKRVKEVLEQFGLATVKASLVEKLSGGQRKRLSIAMEYISDPYLFVLDEPDSGLDGVIARDLMRRLRTRICSMISLFWQRIPSGPAALPSTGVSMRPENFLARIPWRESCG